MREEFRVFVASPADVQPEREALARAVDEINETVGEAQDYRLELVRWETHAVPDAGRPQQVINKQLSNYEVFVGIMWKRFGTPTGEADSGTEEEFRIAYAAWERDHSRPVMFYFSQKPFIPRSQEDLDQMSKVLKFRAELQGKMLTWDYAGPEVFEAEIRKHLCKRMTRLLAERKQKLGPLMQPDPEANATLLGAWNYMTPDLRNALSIAYNENRRAGDGGIKTEDLFAALRQIGSKDLEPVLNELPEEALPKRFDGPVTAEPYILSEKPWLSHCVASSIKRLGEKVGDNGKISATDVFVDIAKRGTGSSVAQLRKHGIDSTRIDHILQTHGITPLLA